MKIFKKPRFFHRLSKKKEKPFLNLPAGMEKLPEFRRFFLLVDPSNVSYDNRDVIRVDIKGSKAFLYNLIINPGLTITLFRELTYLLPPSHIFFAVDEKENKYVYAPSSAFLRGVNKQLSHWHRISLLSPYASLKGSVKAALSFLDKEHVIEDQQAYLENITFALTHLLKELSEVEKEKDKIISD